MKIRLKVIKADGTSEQYLHTKVVNTINRTLSDAGMADMQLAEELAEVIAYYLYKKHGDTAMPSCAIHSVIKVVLTATGNEETAEMLSRHHFERKLNRSRVQVVFGNIEDISDAEMISEEGGAFGRDRWDKSVIINDLISKHHFDRKSARATAAMVEERVFNLRLSHVPSGLVKQLMLNDAAAILRAQKQLQSA